MPDKLTQGQRIRKLRIERRYTQEYLADRLGTTKQAIYKYEADIVRRIPEDKLQRLACLLGCSVEWLQGLTETVGSAPQLAAPFLGAKTADDPFQLYQEFMDVMCLLSPEERRTALDFAQYLLSRHRSAGKI
jgi:transcriptional regulator with XRE-family HTH domain